MLPLCNVGNAENTSLERYLRMKRVHLQLVGHLVYHVINMQTEAVAEQLRQFLSTFATHDITMSTESHMRNVNVLRYTFLFGSESYGESL